MKYKLGVQERQLRMSLFLSTYVELLVRSSSLNFTHSDELKYKIGETLDVLVPGHVLEWTSSDGVLFLSNHPKYQELT